MDFVFDRTVEDVMEAVDLQNRITAFGFQRLAPADQDKWLNGMKGFFNFTDFNRINQNVVTLAATLGVPVTAQPNWTRATIPTLDDMETLRGNISALRAARPGPTNVPWSLNFLSIDRVNNIEKILYEVWRTTQ